jgi:DNA-binding NtrC family response regulator
VLEERTIRPVGSNHETPIDVRVIAATNRNLSEEVARGNFREDLYYRLNVLSIRMPALRERGDDIPDLVRHFIDSLSTEMGISSMPVSDAEMALLKSYAWPGNVRELKNTIERSLLLNANPSDCLPELKNRFSSDVSDADEEDEILLEDVEKRHILKVLDMEGGNKSAAARRLGVSRKTLERKTQAWGVKG